MFSPFDNPLTRNRNMPSVQFAKSDAERKNLSLPKPISYDSMLEQYRNMHVPQQNVFSSSNLGDFPINSSFRNGMRIINMASSHTRCWGDPWGRDERQNEDDINKRSAEYAKRSRIENAKLMAELEKDQFRKQLLADVDSGKLFPKTRLIEVPEEDITNGTITYTQKYN